MYILPIALCLISTFSVDAVDTNACPFTKYERYLRFHYPVTGYIYCTTGCCGYVDDRSCCPKPSDYTGVYVGCVSGVVVLVVTIIGITSCCIAKYNRRHVMIGMGSKINRSRIAPIAPAVSRGNSRRPCTSCNDQRYKHYDRPPPYEMAVYTIPEEESQSESMETTPSFSLRHSPSAFTTQVTPIDCTK